jgi:formylmethanofuran dehydrogenase subunit C
MPITLRLTQPPTVPLEAEAISPDVFAALSNADIRALTVYHGKRQRPLGDFFDVDGERSDDLELHGDLHRVRWIGRGMSRGRITVHGSVGMHLGAHMKGGQIEVHGDASDWIGAEMTNGLIRVHGNAGGQVGAAYRGTLSGMRNGTIIVDGSAAMEVGMRMRRGTIVIGGRVKDFTGLQMKGGTIVLLSGAEIRTGAWMVRGTIISLAPLQLMPTFGFACSYIPPFLNLYAKQLAGLGIDLPTDPAAGSYERYTGDFAVPGKGEVLVWRPTAEPEA